MLITTKAIVFSALKYGEADLIVKCFTLQSGLKTYLLRGVLKSKKGKIKASLFQPLTRLEVVASHKDKGTLEYMKEAKLAKAYQSLHTNMLKSSVVMFLAEVLKNAVKEEEANPELYNFLDTSLEWFDTHGPAVNFHLLFLLKLSRYLGFYPDDSQCDAPVFNLVDGTFQEVETNPDCINDENVGLLQRLLGTDFDELSAIKLNQTTRSGFLLMLLKYYEIHLQGFHKPKSLAVLNEIYS
ncbi:DNA repair protein RecO [Salinimicrobium tongyeongense]|jgi:DNA repair protein RecO (recombination protein O)|uniref:DNA repair protein RecO n=1 Tax=Salinimicrobium tongyeongense TaxID=2809707 RepID=A0ABY6NM89_9FLAO|nr:DNA repair protein RecO [Salinimicrobium tongyeongense]UZH54005.1 DNA repair protein RecO [Salinimicrobium tongyeongense]